jgi:chaperonin GroEL
MTITKDGVTVAKSITLKDAAQNMAISTLKEAASRTATQAGDGTTTSIVLAEAILNAADKYKSDIKNQVEVARNIKEITKVILDKLEDRKIDVTDELIKHVATTSANNDEVMGGIIAEAYKEVGSSGIVTVQNSKNHKTYFESTSGIQFQRGLMSPIHITDVSRDVCELEDPLILVTDIKIQSFRDIIPIAEYAVKVAKRPLLIIGDLEFSAQQTFNSNILKNNFKAAYVQLPDFGWRREEMMEDLALSVGCKFMSQKSGDNWELFDPATELGEAERVKIGRDSTTIIHKEGELSEAIQERIADIQEQLKNEKQDDFIDACRARISMLEGNAAVIYVGADTEIEKKELKDRIDDAVLATRAAIDHGVLPGGGISLLGCTPAPVINEEDPNSMVAAKIMTDALQEPFRQILLNIGMEEGPIQELSEKLMKAPVNEGYNAKAGVVGDMFEMGITDPARVTTQALKNAVSVATTIMTTNTVVVEIDEE